MKDMTSNFREQLNQAYQWPAIYTFKFVVPKSKHSALLAAVPSGDISERRSSSGKYISVTIKAKMQSAQEVVSIYQGMSLIEGVISL